MKKLLLLLAAVGMIFTACETGGVDEGSNGTPTQSNKIATIEEQGANITATIATLQTTKSAVEATIASLKASEESATRGNDNGNNDVMDMIAALEERLAALEQMIANLTGYTQGDLTEMQDWATATFATMEQYSALASELAMLKAAIAEIEGVSTTELSEALAASEESMKQWVNEQLSGYATIADVEAQIAALQASLTEESESLRKDIEALVATLTSLKEEIEYSYKEAIETAINDFAGVINEQITSEIAAVNKRIDDGLATINSRLDAIEKRLDEIEEQLKNLVNRIQSVSYIREYGSEATPVVTSAEGASVTLDFEMSPKSSVEDLSLKWEEYVKVQALYSGTTDFMNLPITSFSADVEKGIVTIVASCEDLSAEFYSDLQAASLRLEISDGNNDRRSEYIPLKAQRWFLDKIDIVPNGDEWYYTTTDSNAVTPNNTINVVNIESNLYDRKKGVFVLKFTHKTTGIHSGAFEECETLRAFAMPNTITEIGHMSFYKCISLKNVLLSESTTQIKNFAFAHCGQLTDAIIPNNVEAINDNAFYECTSLTSITIPDSVVNIGRSAFDMCGNVKNLTIGNSVKEIGISAFALCSMTDLTIPDSVTKIGTEAFYQCNDIRTIYIGKNVAEIGTDAFFVYGDEHLSTIKISDLSAWCKISFENEYSNPFNMGRIVKRFLVNDIEMKSITIPSDIKRIKPYAFYNCYSLREVIIPDHVTSIGLSAFCECGRLDNVTIGSNVTDIGSNAFHLCTNITNITIPDSVTRIGANAFRQCSNLKSVTIGSGVTYVGGYAFDNNKITRVDIHDLSAWCNIDFSNYSANPINDMGKLYINGTEATEITIPSIITEIKDYTFYGCYSLTKVIIPNGVTKIGKQAFWRCEFMTSVTIPESVTEIVNDAFGFCYSLIDVYCKPITPPIAPSDIFYFNKHGRKIYVPRESVDAYKVADGWSDYADSIVGYDF